MSQIKDNLSAYKHLIKSLLVVLRTMMFEKFTAIFFFFYLLSVLSLGFVLSVLHWGVAVVVLLLGLVLFTRVLSSFQFLKRALIFKGDRIEYADPKASEALQMFKTAKVLLKMRPAEVQRTKLLSEELMQGNKHFYLVEADKKSLVIAYDWIIGLSPELLD